MVRHGDASAQENMGTGTYRHAPLVEEFGVKGSTHKLL